VPGLRDGLEEIVNGGKYVVWEQPAAIEELAREFAHSICLVDDEFDRGYNCYTFALGLVDNDRVYEILRKDAGLDGFADIKVGVEYVVRLIKDGVLIRDDDGPVVLYLEDDIPVHAGIVDEGRIQSKWGIGHLWEHDLWEVPRSYGDKTERYRIDRPELLEPSFEEYSNELIEAKGGYRE
jgi:hypothetical protein